METKEPKTSPDAGLAPYPRPASAWYATVLLAFLYWVSILDRTVISFLVDPLKADIGITDVQFGMLHGLAFAITFSIFGLFAGVLADRVSRKKIVFFSVAIWSLATAACGLAKNFTMLMVARVGVGFGESGLNPAANSTISDMFPKSKLTLALAVYALGASVGAGCAYLVGGLLIDWVSTSSTFALPLLGEVKPWQAVFIIVGLPGLALALLSLTLPEPVRRGQRAVDSSSTLTQAMLQGYPALLKFMAANKRFFTMHYLGFGLASTGFVAGNAWYPAHMARTFGWSGSDIGLSLGLSMIIGGAIGKISCGLATEALFKRGVYEANFLWYGTCLLLATPAGIIATTSGDPWVFLIGITIMVALLSTLTAVYAASLNLTVPNELRGKAIAFYAASVGLVSLSLGPILIAWFSDTLYGGNQVGLGMATLFGSAYPIAGLILLFGRQAYRQCVERANQW
jgi:MFS family permease